MLNILFQFCNFYRLSNELLISQLQSSENIEKIERLTLALNREKYMKAEAEEKLQTHKNIGDYYLFSSEHKFR